jgi:hypothetical protein
MTAEAALPDSTPEPGEGEPLHCYRHPDRETWVRCGRCDRPICPACAMQGPVGFRCRDCGKPVRDPLTSLTPTQAVVGFLIAAGAGAVSGWITLQLGIWGIFIGFFAGGIIADLVMRVTGFKRGPRMAAVLLGGIAVGALLAAGLGFLLTATQVAAAGGGSGIDLLFLTYLSVQAPWLAVCAGAAMFGAWGRLRV